MTISGRDCSIQSYGNSQPPDVYVRFSIITYDHCENLDNTEASCIILPFFSAIVPLLVSILVNQDRNVGLNPLCLSRVSDHQTLVPAT